MVGIEPILVFFQFVMRLGDVRWSSQKSEITQILKMTNVKKWSMHDFIIEYIGQEIKLGIVDQIELI